MRLTQPSVQWIPEGISLRVKPSGREADHPALFSVEGKKRGAISTVLQCVFMAWCLVKQ